MAKRLSQSNTILNYFLSKQATKPEPAMATKPDDSDDDEVAPVVKKRARVLSNSSDSDTENIEQVPKTPKKQKTSSSATAAITSASGLTKKYTFAASATPETKDKFSAAKSPSKPGPSSSVAFEEKTTRWLHETLQFLKQGKIMDAKRRKPDHPDYDATTLHVPTDYLDSLTPAMRQWWQLKSKYFDTVLFFKVGKFYELYHMDACVGVEHLGFSFMKGEFAHSGFPEVGYGRMASSLVEKGFKVGRVEQTETPEMMTERCKTIRPTKFDKVVNREVCQVSSKGACISNAQTLDMQDAQGCYMIAISERKSDLLWKHFGVCFIDLSIGIFNVAEFDDDQHCSRLLTLIAQHNPALLLLERGGTTNETTEVLNTHLRDIKKELLKTGEQFPEADGTIETLKRECYFKNEQGNLDWPEIFDELLESHTFVKMGYTHCLRSLGACIWYLKRSLIDVQVVQMKKFNKYVPINLQLDENLQHRRIEYMVMDSVVLENLNLLGGVGSLQKTLDYCCTAFGKRLFQQWICRPLCDVYAIEKRQTAVQELYDNPELLKATRGLLAKLPDIERYIAKIHRYGNAFVAKNHPDSRAILYEQKTYSKRKINDFMSTLEAFQLFTKFTSLFANCQSKLLCKVTQYAPTGELVDLSEHLKFFQNAFDHKQAKEEGVIIPERGVDDDYDEIQRQIRKVRQKLDNYLEEQRKFFRCDVKYFGSDKKRFQLEIPENRCGNIPRQYQLEGTKKGAKPVKRYSTEESRSLLAEVIRIEGENARILQDLSRRVFEKFGQRYRDWERALYSVTILDCLCSLAEYARLYIGDISMPKMLPFSDTPVCHMINASHPCINRDKVALVPNDVHLGKERQPVMILTGPNMGGKSTYMRQTVLIAIMAQMGSFVPALSCELSLSDRVFTRMGSQDDILRGRSTFLVELLEASAILKHASKHSLVLLDELGRGTSTHDGNAIARAYIGQLAHLKCRVIFSTHYHSLVQKYQNNKDIQLAYMTCMLENEGSVNERVVFLYKVAEGLWPNSYGFHVALLAGIPETIVSNGRQYAAAMERKDRNRNMLKNLDNVDEVLKILSLK